MVDIIHKVGIKAPISKVYAAIATPEGVAGWWTKETTGGSELGSTFKVVFHGPAGELKGEMELELLKLDSNELVVWRVKAGPEEWIGTDLTFALSQRGEQTIVIFGHRNWREAVEFTAHCSMKWATFLLSLRQLVETGTGKPAPHDLKIDDWN
jgi:uncharacterized protein YndB with AHSA1/START domain